LWTPLCETLRNKYIEILNTSTASSFSFFMNLYYQNIITWSLKVFMTNNLPIFYDDQLLIFWCIRFFSWCWRWIRKHGSHRKSFLAQTFFKDITKVFPYYVLPHGPCSTYLIYKGKWNKKRYQVLEDKKIIKHRKYRLKKCIKNKTFFKFGALSKR